MTDPCAECQAVIVALQKLLDHERELFKWCVALNNVGGSLGQGTAVVAQDIIGAFMSPCALTINLSGTDAQLQVAGVTGGGNTFVWHLTEGKLHGPCKT